MYTILKDSIVIPVDKSFLSSEVQDTWNNLLCKLLINKRYKAKAIKWASKYVLDIKVLEVLKKNGVIIPDEFTFAKILYKTKEQLECKA